MQLPFELAGMDHPAHDLNTEAYRRLSPFGQIPSIDDDGLVLSESAAIVAHFDRSGSYASTVWVAAGINVLGMLVAGRLPAR